MPAVLLVVRWLLKGTRLRLLAVELLTTAGPLCSSQCLCGTILMLLCLMVMTLILRAEQMPSYWPNLLFLFVSYYFLFSSFRWVGFVGLGLRTGRVFAVSPSLALLTLFNNNNNNNKNFYLNKITRYNFQNNKVQMIWLTSWPVVSLHLNQVHKE